MVDTQMSNTPRGIAIVDVGYSNTKVILFNSRLEALAERKIPSPHYNGKYYGEIDVEAMLKFLATTLPELDAILPIDKIVTSAHGACIVAMTHDSRPAVPIMDYMSEPPQDVLAAYSKICPSFAETYSPQLPMALLHAMQLFWQSRILPHDFAKTKTILPLMQYVAHRLGGRAVSEISALGCQSHLLDLNTFGPSKLAQSQGWAAKLAPRANAWDGIGTLDPAFKSKQFRGRGEILAGVHDSNANFLRYLASGTSKFTLLSTGTWIIGFDSEADVKQLDPARDTVANVSVLGKAVASCRFFGGKEFEVLAEGAPGHAASLASAAQLVRRDTFALPSFSGGGGPVPDTADKGRIIGPPPQSTAERASLASLYCALMVSESLDAIQSRHAIIVDGPFSQNEVFLTLLAALRPSQIVKASELKDGTAAGAACLALMPNGLLPHVDTNLRDIALDRNIASAITAYQAQWRKHIGE